MWIILIKFKTGILDLFHLLNLNDYKVSVSFKFKLLVFRYGEICNVMSSYSRRSPPPKKKLRNFEKFW